MSGFSNRRNFVRIKRSDFVDGESYARALRDGGLEYGHIFGGGGGGFGIGEDAEFLKAVWGENPDRTLELEAEAAPKMPHKFNKKYAHTRRGRKKKSP